MKADSLIILFLLAIIGLLVADKLGWLPEGGVQATAVPQPHVVVATAAPDPQLVPVNTAVPSMATAVFIEDWAGSAPTATWTAVPPTGPRLMQGCSESRPETCPGQGEGGQP